MNETKSSRSCDYWSSLCGEARGCVISFFCWSVPIGFFTTSLVDADQLGDAMKAANEANHKQAVRLLDQFLEKNPTDARGFYLRGRENFRSAKIDQSLKDFDRFIELSPRAKSRLWERGITCYYASKFKEGAQQFELYQTYHSEDVENGVWHILCKSRVKGFKKASQDALEIRNDPRVPMMQIYDLFRGKIEPAEVLEAANQPGSQKQTNAQLFYAHLYLGLYFEVNQNGQQAKTHLEKAVEHKIDHYMWDVARVHCQLLKKTRTEEAKKKS